MRSRLLLFGLVAAVGCSGGAAEEPAGAPPPEPEPAGPPITVPETTLAGDPCDAAYEEFSAFVTEMRRLNSDARAPDQATFLAACHSLPEAARPCLSPSWGLDHEQACRQIMSAVDSDLRKQVQDAMALRERKR